MLFCLNICPITIYNNVVVGIFFVNVSKLFVCIINSMLNNKRNTLKSLRVSNVLCIFAM